MGGSSYWGQFLSIFPSSPTSSRGSLLQGLIRLMKANQEPEPEKILSPTEAGKLNLRWHLLKML